MSNEKKYCDETYFGCGLSPLIKIGIWYLSTIVVKRFTYIDTGVGMVVLETPVAEKAVMESRSMENPVNGVELPERTRVC